jgi:lipoprotein-releasing system permease protein
MRPFELFVGLRYTRAKRRTHFISFISLVSMLGIALGIAALITVMSVMNGFEKEIRARILGAAAHIQVLGGEKGIEDWESVARDVKTHPDVTAAAPFVGAQALLSTGTAVRGVFIRGVLPDLEDKVADFGTHMRKGRLADLRPANSGSSSAWGSRARCSSASATASPHRAAGAGHARGPHAAPEAVHRGRRLLHGPQRVRLGAGAREHAGCAGHLPPRDQRHRRAAQGAQPRRRAAHRPRPHRVVRTEAQIADWTQQNVNYFRAIQIEKRMMFIILTLIIAVAAFNLVSTLVMVVTDKHPDIAIMRTLGASPASIMKIFVVQGAVIGIVGTAIGVTTWHPPRAQRGRGRARGRAHVQLPDPLAGGVLHQRAALGLALARRVVGGAGVALPLLRRDDLSELASVAGKSGRGVAI